MKKQTIFIMIISLILFLIIGIIIVQTKKQDTLTVKPLDTFANTENIPGKQEEYNGVQEINKNIINSSSNSEVTNTMNNENTTDNSKSINDVTLDIDKDTLTNTGVTVIITDNHTPHYSWGEEYTIQQNINGEWKNLTPIRNMIVRAIACLLDNNNQYRHQINWENDYGKLSSGLYRIVKDIRNFDGSYISFYSNEFKIE